MRGVCYHVRKTISLYERIIAMKTCYTMLASQTVHTACHTGAQEQLTTSLLLGGPDGVRLAGAGGAHDDHKARELLL